MKQVSPKIDERAAEWFVAHFQTLNQGVTYALESFPAIYRRTLAELRGRFNESELSLILDVVNGLLLTPQFAGQHLLAEVEDGIMLDGLAEKWQIDGAELILKIESLAVGQIAVLEIWAKAFWTQGRDMAEWIKNLL